MADEAVVVMTVKEILARMDSKLDNMLEKLDDKASSRDVHKLEMRVDKLEAVNDLESGTRSRTVKLSALAVVISAAGFVVTHLKVL